MTSRAKSLMFKEGEPIGISGLCRNFETTDGDRLASEPTIIDTAKEKSLEKDRYLTYKGRVLLGKIIETQINARWRIYLPGTDRAIIIVEKEDYWPEIERTAVENRDLSSLYVIDDA
jgi:hypothetical protein